MKFINELKKYPLFQKDDFIRSTFRIAVPMVLQQLVTSMVNFLDNLMVGQLGELEISGVAASNKYFMIALFAMIGISAASGAFISQYHGAGKAERVRQSYHFSLLGTSLATLIMMAPAVFFPRMIAAFFTPDPGIHGPMAAYMPIAALAYIPQIYSMSAQNAMRCLGETRLPLFASVTAVIANAFFNWVLIFGHFGLPALGVSGAALGTLLARTLEMLLTLAIVSQNPFPFKGRFLRLIRIPKDLARAIVKRAFPLTINEVGFGTGMAMLFKFYGTRGPGVLAAMNIMGTISDVFFVLFSGMAVANAIVVGQELGANQLEKARSNAYRLYKLALLVSLGFASLMFLSSYFFPSLFQVNEATRNMAIFFIRIYSLFYLVYTMNCQVYFTLRSGGDAKHTLMMDSGWFWFINVPIVGLATYLTDWSIFWIFLLGQLTDLFKCFFSTHLLLRETWLKNLTAETDALPEESKAG